MHVTLTYTSSNCILPAHGYTAKVTRLFSKESGACETRVIVSFFSLSLCLSQINVGNFATLMLEMGVHCTLLALNLKASPILALDLGDSAIFPCGYDITHIYRVY